MHSLSLVLRGQLVHIFKENKQPFKTTTAIHETEQTKNKKIQLVRLNVDFSSSLLTDQKKNTLQN